MGLLDLDWYSRLLGVKFALLSHSDLLRFGLPGFQRAIETCCASAEEVRWLSSRYYTNTVWLGPHHGITRPRLAHHGCWESNSLCYPTVTCCCGLPRDYSDCSVLYISLSLFYVLLEAVHVSHTLCVVYAIPKGQCNDWI